jgi:cold shock CspA family protein
LKRPEGEKIKWFDHHRHYGFIQSDNGLQDVFVHMNEFRSISEAYWVRDRYAVEVRGEQAFRGPKAIDVIILGGENDNVQDR